ncbi:tyrosine-type recombinase/integrase [Shewanella intestini]|uniref:Site-specific integrase n=1 Tax=Shewanella intestini TaxID=2017544 RepID=A0ABS5I016_9GAMM|nr:MULTISPECIES: site-specific integrase [Shewanella]MBR9727266.1 site-specific integrase [Shewanella intestini]MRG36068.1 tyrosine-type recombinase/integrase [Shewanella sp. XMDDZSB0408]
MFEKKPPVYPLFDSADYVLSGNQFVNQHITQITLRSVSDAGLIIEHCSDWLFEQRQSENNYKTYRSELTTFLHWCFDVASISPIKLTRKDIGRYINYCEKPPKELIGTFNVPQFKTDKATEIRYPNAAWRPFTAKKKDGKQQPYNLSDSALKTKIAIVSSFYGYLISEEYTERNPAQLWLKHSRFAINRKFIKNEDDNQKAFTKLQWSYVVSTVSNLAETQPEKHQRSLFLINLLYSCYLRISEISGRAGYSPMMNQFRKDIHNGIWYFHVPFSKSGKARNIAISKSLLNALIDYRQFLGLPDLPSIDEQQPLFVRHKAAAHGRDSGLLNANLGIRHLRDELNHIIALAADIAFTDGFEQESQLMRKLTAHNIRHTGITHDINLNQRPLSHVQADAGHESIDTTSQYLHTTQTERHQSAANKPLDHLK